MAHVRASGAAVAYEPDARVRHVVAADRLRVAWLFRRAWQGGLNAHASAAAGGRPVPGGPTAALGHVALRGWRAAYRRSRNADTVREALLSELCHRTAGLAQLRSVRGERR